MNLFAAIANRLFKSIHLTPSASVMLSFSPNLLNKTENANNISNNNSSSKILKSKPLLEVLPLYNWKFLALKSFLYLYMLCYLPRALYIFSLMMTKDNISDYSGVISANLGANLCKLKQQQKGCTRDVDFLVKSSGGGGSTYTFSTSMTSLLSAPSTNIRNHLFYDPVLTTYALTNNISTYLLIIVSFGLMTLYTMYLDFIVFFRSVQWGPLFEEAKVFHFGVPLIFNWQRPFTSIKTVFKQALSLKRNSLVQGSFNWGSFSTLSKFFDRQTIGRAIALYQVMNVLFSGVLLFFAFITIIIFFFVLNNVLKVLGRGNYWSLQSQWVLGLAATDQLITCYIAWNGARISIAGVEAFLGSYYGTSRQSALLSGDLKRLCATVEATQREKDMLVNNNNSFSKHSLTMLGDCFYASLTLHRRQHRRLVVFAEAVNGGLISPVLVATFLLNCLINAAVLASFLYTSLSTKDVITNLSILWFQVVNIGSVCTLCVRYSKTLYRTLTPLSLRAVNLSGGPPPKFVSVVVGNGGGSNDDHSGTFRPRFWNKGFRVERWKVMAFYEGVHQKVGARGRFHFTVGPMAYITTKAVVEVCLQ